MNQDQVKHGVCVSCGHVKELGAYQIVEKKAVGICVDCREAARKIRGPCSDQKECLCKEFDKYISWTVETFEPLATGNGLLVRYESKDGRGIGITNQYK